MATKKQRDAAKKNITKAQKKWKSMSKRARSRSQPEGRGRKKPGTTGKGEYYRIEVRDEKDFVTIRTQDVGRRGGLQRVAGKRSSGSWDTITWLVSKEYAHVSDKDELILDSPRAKTMLKQIRGPIKHTKGDVFTAKPRKNIPEKEKPTRAQQEARSKNIKKAQKARHKKS